MKIVTHSIIGLGIILTLSGCGKSEEELLKEQEALEIQELETLLDERKYNDFLDEFNLTNNSNTEELMVLGDRFVDELVREKKSENKTEFINANYGYLNNIPYFSDISKKKIEKVLEEEKELLLDEMEQSIKDGNFIKAINIFKKNNLVQNTEDGNALFYYATSLNNSWGYESFEAKQELAENVNPSYSGRMSEEINEAFNVEEGYIGIDHSSWEYYYKENQKSDVYIGMTSGEVLESKWGKPYDINRTTTTSGVSEQWVYDDYKYLYFEDGILTTIQE